MERPNYLTKLIFTILSKNEEARDNQLLVIKTIHDFELSMLGGDKTTYYDFFFQGKLSSTLTISRIWRKVQEENENLRGKEWELRQVQAGLVSIEMVMASKGQLRLFDM